MNWLANHYRSNTSRTGIIPRVSCDKRMDCVIENSVDLNNMVLPGKRHIIINPASAGGKTARLKSDILKIVEQQIGSNYSVRITECPMDAAMSAAEALTLGCTKLLVAGGDGTINEVINGLQQNSTAVLSACTLGIISSGSGEGLARSLGLPRTLEDQVHVALCGEPRMIDVARVTCTDTNGNRMSRLFANEAQIGIGAEVVRRTTRHRKRVGGLLAYGMSTLSPICRYRSSPMTIVVDGNCEISREVLGIAIGNGAITAGGMRLTPNANPNDGLLDILIMIGQNFPRRLQSFARIYSGEAPEFPSVRGTSLTVRSAAPVGVSADGEFLGFLPCTIELLPSSLQILCPTHKKVRHEHSFEQITAA